MIGGNDISEHMLCLRVLCMCCVMYADLHTFHKHTSYFPYKGQEIGYTVYTLPVGCKDILDANYI